MTREAREAVERQARNRPPFPPLTPLQERAMMLIFGDMRLRPAKDDDED